MPLPADLRLSESRSSVTIRSGHMRSFGRNHRHLLFLVSLINSTGPVSARALNSNEDIRFMVYLGLCAAVLMVLLCRM